MTRKSLFTIFAFSILLTLGGAGHGSDDARAIYEKMRSELDGHNTYTATCDQQSMRGDKGQLSSRRVSVGKHIHSPRHYCETMTEVNNYTTAIASAVEQQGAATAEISQNVQRAAEATGTVSSSMTQLSQAVDQTASSADMVLSASGELTTKTDMLKSEVESFLSQVAAA